MCKRPGRTIPPLLLNTCRVPCRCAILVFSWIVIRRSISQKDLQDLEVAGECVAGNRYGVHIEPLVLEHIVWFSLWQTHVSPFKSFWLVTGSWPTPLITPLTLWIQRLQGACVRVQLMEGWSSVHRPLVATVVINGGIWGLTNICEQLDSCVCAPTRLQMSLESSWSLPTWDAPVRRRRKRATSGFKRNYVFLHQVH